MGPKIITNGCEETQQKKKSEKESIDSSARKQTHRNQTE